MNKVLVFISSPFSRPSTTHNVHKAAQEYNWMWMHLGDRIIPISMVVSSSLQDTICPRDYDEWLDLCIDMLKKCDIVYVLPGESSGKDKEIASAKSMGIPVVYSREDLEKYLSDHPEILDTDIARIRREIGSQLYDARRRGVDMAKIGVGEARKAVGNAINMGAKAIGSQIVDFAIGPKTRRTNEQER